MHYPDFSQLWLDDVKNGNATALANSFSADAYSQEVPVALDALKPSTALGKRAVLGSWNDAPLIWTVVSVNRDYALLLCDTIVAAQQLFAGAIDSSAPGWWCETPSWLNADINRWLNLTFRREAIGFGTARSSSVEPAFCDRSPNPHTVVVPSTEEVEAYVPQELRPCMETSWWLRNPSGWDKDAKPTYVDSDGTLCAGGTAYAFRGVRPMITVKFWS